MTGTVVHLPRRRAWERRAEEWPFPDEAHYFMNACGVSDHIHYCLQTRCSSHFVSSAFGFSRLMTRNPCPSHSRLTLSHNKSDFLISRSEHTYINFVSSSSHKLSSSFRDFQSLASFGSVVNSPEYFLSFLFGLPLSLLMRSPCKNTACPINQAHGYPVTYRPHIPRQCPQNARTACLSGKRSQKMTINPCGYGRSLLNGYVSNISSINAVVAMVSTTAKYLKNA